MAKIQRLLDAERQLSQQHKAELALLQRQYRAVCRLRRSENRRALVEGCRFQMHTANGGGRGVRMVRAYYCETEAALRLAEELPQGVKTSGGGAGGGGVCRRRGGGEHARAQLGSSALGLPPPHAHLM